MASFLVSIDKWGEERVKRGEAEKEGR